MNTSPAVLMTEAYCACHRHMLTYLQKMTDEQLRWQPPGSNCIAWHAWHLARWADYFQATVPAMTPELSRRLGTGVQIWEVEKLADRWQFDASRLGYGATGMQMPDDVALKLPFPPQAELLAYMAQAFSAAERAVAAIDDEQLMSAEQPQPLTEGIWGAGTVADALLAHIRHDNRHLGMMEALLGLQGQAGSSTI